MTGFDLVAELTGLEARIAAADLVVTGEGSLDSQSLAGKAPVGIARLARKHGKPVWACCGRADAAVSSSGLFDEIHELAAAGRPTAELMADAAIMLEKLLIPPFPSEGTRR